MIATGVITADKITVTELSALSANMGTITAGVLAVGTEFAGTLNAASGTFGTITAGDLTGVTITGSTIETATSGQRIRIVSSASSSPSQPANSLFLIDSNGNDIFDFGSNAGIICSIHAFSDQYGLVVQGVSTNALTSTLASFSVLSSSASGIAVSIEQDGSGSALVVSAVNDSDVNYVVSITNANYIRNMVKIDSGYSGSTATTMLLINRSGAAAGTALNISDAGIGDSLDITHTGSSGSSLSIAHSGSGSSQAVKIQNSGGGRTLEIDSTSSGNTNNVIYISGAYSLASVVNIQNALISSHFQLIMTLGYSNVYSSDGSNANGNLSANSGDICLNSAGHIAYCTGGTAWTQI